MVINKKEEVIAINQKTEIKEINRITNEIFQLIDKLMIDNKTNENEKINKFTNLFIQIYNLCVVTKDKGKSQLTKLKLEFQKTIKEIKNEKSVTLRKNKLQSINFVILTNIILRKSFKEMIKNIKNLEKKVIIQEFIREYYDKSIDILKIKLNQETN